MIDPGTRVDLEYFVERLDGLLVLACLEKAEPEQVKCVLPFIVQSGGLFQIFYGPVVFLQIFVGQTQVGQDAGNVLVVRIRVQGSVQ